ncbi:MAG: hypothetical protein U1D97_10035 [Desulfuromonadales bacterium]|nr:hypothetical protein [Desulfuromonadales bacterium]
MTEISPQQTIFTPELVQRLQRALLAEGDELFSLVQDCAPEVLRTLLKNRHLAEDHLLALLRRRDLAEDLLKALHQHELTTTSYRLKLALAVNPKSPPAVLQPFLPHLHLFDLLGICLHPGTTPDQKLAAERTIVQRLPGVPLGNRITLARRAPSTLLVELLGGGEAQVVSAALDNPRLKEGSVVQFLSGGRATSYAITTIFRHLRWQKLPSIRSTLLKNPQTPECIFRQLLASCPLSEIKNLRLSNRLTTIQKLLIAQELKRRQG